MLRGRRVLGTVMAAVGTFLIATSTAGAHHPAGPTAPAADRLLTSSLAEHWDSHGAAGSVAGRESVSSQAKGLDARREVRYRGQDGRRGARG